MKGHLFTKYFSNEGARPPFERLLEILKEVLSYTNGDLDEALDWMDQLHKEYGLYTDEYSKEDFLDDLFQKNFVDSQDSEKRGITSKMEQALRKSALDQIFGKIKRSDIGDHKTGLSGKGDEVLPELRQYEFGDPMNQIALTESFKNAQIRSGMDNITWSNEDLIAHEKTLQVSTSTVLMIDISHSMILYGEDRITPAKKVAMALAEFIRTKFPKDSLDIIVFGNDAWEVKLKDLPYLQVGPFHTNTVAGLRLAQDILRKKRTPNKQILMITDGKPSCLKEGSGYYKNSFGLDRKIVNKTLNEAVMCRRNKIGVTTFMVASDPYLVEFIDEFTEACKGKAFYSGLDKLGAFVLHDYTRNKRKRF